MAFTNLEQQILDIVQDNFPLEERPYLALSKSLNVSEKEIFNSVENLRNQNVIRRIGGIYDTKKLGFISRLCAGTIPCIFNGAKNDEALNDFANEVLKINSITHNYVRSHFYNVWFTIIGENESYIQNVLKNLCQKTQLKNVHTLAANKMFKINTVLKNSANTKNNAESPAKISSNILNKTITESDKKRIYLASGDLPHSLTPFNDLGLNINELKSDLEQKIMRRFGAVLRHQQAGFAFNAMVCFNVKNASEAGKILAQNTHISHCYERDSFENFPYNLYAMMHAQSESELQNFINDAAASLNHPDYTILHSIKELKKTSYRHFAD